MAKPYQWDIPIVMQAQNKLDFSNSTPAVWLMKKNMPRNFSIPDITDENYFIIVNPEEIGRQTSYLASRRSTRDTVLLLKRI